MSRHRCDVCRVVIDNGPGLCDAHRRIKLNQSRLALADIQNKNCEGQPELFAGRRHVTADKARKLCVGCPALGKECRAFKELLGVEWTWGVLDGEARYID